MKHIHILIKPASSLCNLRCKYCFYADVSSLREVRSYGKMKAETSEKMIANVFYDLDDGDELTLTFQGGEPTLAGLNYFKYIVACVAQQPKHVGVHYALQTNGIVINEQWCRFLKENNFLIGLSIDGLPMYHDLNRVDTHGRGTFQRVLKTKTLFDRYQIDYNVLCVLTNPLAKEAKKVFEFIKTQNIKFIQFIPCLDELEATSRSGYALTPQRFALFYKNLLQLWLDELESGHYISIKLFDDLYNLFVRKQVTACGLTGNCTVQYVIEADGSVYPCDFFVLDQYRLGYIQDQTLKELFEQDSAKNFIFEKQVLPEYCNSCPFKQYCCGGCKRMKDAIYVNKAGNYCGYQELLKLYVPQIQRIIDYAQTASITQTA
ncbi:SPASM domain-containing protein [Loigolactobacillus zhaoyuanensis]|uniref:SPASM domain-containing protein n=1 Tax=Loigolactobacillus zhaoyuanensis TaxID=2486017 RepID=A0ABW8UEN5_9LACO